MKEKSIELLTAIIEFLDSTLLYYNQAQFGTFTECMRFWYKSIFWRPLVEGRMHIMITLESWIWQSPITIKLCWILLPLFLQVPYPCYYVNFIRCKASAGIVAQTKWKRVISEMALAVVLACWRFPVLRPESTRQRYSRMGSQHARVLNLAPKRKGIRWHMSDPLDSRCSRSWQNYNVRIFHRADEMSPP
jgi:hypothetical protein